MQILPTDGPRARLQVGGREVVRVEPRHAELAPAFPHAHALFHGYAVGPPRAAVGGALRLPQIADVVLLQFIDAARVGHPGLGLVASVRGCETITVYM